MNDSDDILSRLRSQRDLLETQLRDVDTAIAVVSRALGSPIPEAQTVSAAEQATAIRPGQNGGQPEAKGHSGSSAIELAPDAFFRMSIADAAKKYLGMVKRKQSIQQIADALERGGMTHTSQRFYGTVLTTLRRQEKQFGDVVKIGRGIWGLAEWYPSRKRKPAAEPKPSEGAPEGS